MSIRTVLAIFAGIITGYIGQRYAASIRREAQQLERWQVLLERLRLLLAEASLPLPSVLCAAADKNGPPDKLLKCIADIMRSNPLASPEASIAHIPQEAAEAPVLCTLLPKLDAGTLESRLLAIDHAHKQIALLAESAKERTRRDAAMWARLGWTAGACLTILLI